MGNCQAAEVATVVVQHPENGKVERIYWSVRANEVMGSNPGFYVALVMESPSGQVGQPVKNRLKLLRPDDSLQLGHVYRLVSFEEVINEFAEKKSVKLGKLLREIDNNNNLGACGSNLHNLMRERDNESGNNNNNSGLRSGGRRHYSCGGGGGQWKPALQSIAEF